MIDLRHPEGRSRARTLTIGILAFALLGVVVAAGFFLSQGGRWFVVATPSMGTSAPVGTLIFTNPTTVTKLHVGSVIAFHPPTAPSETYTHRVLRISAKGGITTKGDINGAADPWTLHKADLIGKAVAVLPGAGWLARAIPLLTVGLLLVVLLTRLVRSRQMRAALRIVGTTLVVSITAFILKPFTGIDLLQTYAAGGKAGATVVSTGLLPIRVTAAHGNHVDLLTGQVGQLTIPTYLEHGYYQISSALTLSVEGWIVFWLMCSIPLIGTMIIGLPPKEFAEWNEFA